MNIQRSIEKQENELKELLKNVMQAPLDPIFSSVQNLNKHLSVLEDLEKQIEELRNDDLAALTQTTNESSKCTRSIKSLVEEIPVEVQNKLKLLLAQELGELQKTYQTSLEKVLIHLKEQTQELRNVDLTALKQATDESNKCTRSIKSLVEEIPAEVKDKLKSLLKQELDEIQKSYHKSLEKVQFHLIENIDALQHRADENEIKLQKLIEIQHEKILQILHLNEKNVLQFKNELSQAQARVKHWLLLNILLAGASLTVIATIATRLYS